MVKNYSALSFLLCICMYAAGQEKKNNRLFESPGEDSIHLQVETIDENEYEGLLLFETNEYIELEVEADVSLRIPKLKILRFEILEKENIIKGEYYFRNPHATRYFYGPNGYGLKKEEGYYQNLWVLFNQVSFGFSDYFSVGTGFIPLFLFGGTPSPAWITPKVSIPIKENKINAGIGVLAATVIGESNTSFGIAYGTFTYGSRDSNATLGTGWAYSADGFGKSPTFSFSGMKRLGKKGYLITENYLISTYDEVFFLFSIGGRTVQKKLAVDYGLVTPLNIGETIIIPWLSITIPFGNI